MEFLLCNFIIEIYFHQVFEPKMKLYFIVFL